jgi:uncharacterized protein (DUF2267 family)
MQYDEFVGQVQTRARLSSNGEAVKAIRSTLSTLATRMPRESVNNLTAQLPEEIAYYMAPEAATVERFGLNDFFEKVSDLEGEAIGPAVHHARAVMSVLLDAVSAGEGEKLKSSFPEEFQPLFESGSEGKLET